MSLRKGDRRRKGGVVCFGLAWLVTVGCGEHQGPGTIEGSRLPDEVISERAASREEAAQKLAATAGAPAPGEQILFGDLHVHSTFSADAFLMSLPVLQGNGANPIANACDYARYCSALDFWSINDHAEGVTPQRWRETQDSIRQCNALAGDPTNPDLVAFLGWEWSQIGRTPRQTPVITRATARRSTSGRSTTTPRPRRRAAGARRRR